jgi:CelD/BcsL family acetyltransferase involved in cellulose biosynthesis
MSLADIDIFANAQTPARYRVSIGNDWSAANWPWRAGLSTPFQRGEWLTAFYDALSRHEPDMLPLIVRVTDGDGIPAFHLPLLCRGVGTLQVVEFADLNMTDFNAPLLGPASPRTPADAQEAWKAVKRALPSCDAVRFTKMPPMIGARPNPLCLAGGLLPAAANGNLLVTGEVWEEYNRSLERTVRKELERNWRVFNRSDDARFVPVTDPAQALTTLVEMEALQRVRMHDLGQSYGLDEPVTADFYRGLITEGFKTGYAVLTTLRGGQDFVAGLLGVYDGETYVMIRLVHRGTGEWSKISAGRLVVHKTMEWLHAQGCRHFDFSVGNYPYKRRFNPTRMPMFDRVEALSARGMPMMLKARGAGWLRARPQLRERVRLMMGKPPSREEF